MRAGKPPKREQAERPLNLEALLNFGQILLAAQLAHYGKCVSDDPLVESSYKLVSGEFFFFFCKIPHRARVCLQRLF